MTESKMNIAQILLAATIEMDKAKADQLAAYKRVQYLQKVIEGLVGLSGDEAPSVAPSPHTGSTNGAEVKEYPSPRAAVLQVLKDFPNQPMQPKTVIAKLKASGAYNPDTKSGDKIYTTALRRLLSATDVKVTYDFFGQYTLLTQPAPDDATLKEAS